MTLKEKVKRFFGGGKALSNEADIEALEDMLIESDFGTEEAMAAIDTLKNRLKKDGGNPESILDEVLKEYLAKAVPCPPLPPPHEDALSVILLLGVNGVGKTTTAAKLAKRLSAYKPTLAALDTFRAGAIDQLKIHGERLGFRVVAHKSGGDSAAVLYDAVNAARADGSRLVIADTAGRMHTKKNLMEEIKKIEKTAINADNGRGSVYIRKFLALDSTTGRNVLSQAEVFNSALKLDGIILTKADSGAKGGAVFTLASRFGLPVVYRCFGEGYDDIEEGAEISLF